MDMLKAVKYIPSRVIFYSLLVGVGATGGLEELISAAKVIGLFEIGYRSHLYGERYTYQDNNKLPIN